MMKKLLNLLFALLMCLSLVACNTKEEVKDDEPIGMANPVVEYASLEEINEKIDVNLLKPAVMGVSNERFSIINNTIAQYECDINGLQWIFRAAHITDEDISGIYNEYNVFEPNQDSGLYVNEFYLDRFFDGDKQYTIVVKDPITAQGYLVLDEGVFSDCCMELKLIQKAHMDDPLVGDYQDTVGQRAIAYVERFGDTYNISVNWSDSNDVFNCWTMFDAVKDGDKLTYQGEQFGQYTYDAEGNVTSSNETASNNVGYFEIKDGMLYWTGAAQEQCRTCVFEKMIYE